MAGYENVAMVVFKSKKPIFGCCVFILTGLVLGVSPPALKSD